MKSDQFLNETTSGAIASVSMPLGKTQKRAESVEVKGLKPVGKKTTSKNKGPYANSIIEGIETKKVSEAELQEDDLIIIPGQKLKRRNGFVPKDQSRVDHEVEMARSDLIAAYKNAKSIFQMLKDRSEEEGIEGWVQEKLIKANDYLNAVKEYYDGKMMREMSGGVIAAGGVGESSQAWQDEFADMIGQMKKSGRLGMPKSNYNFKTPEPKSKEELMSRLKELEAEFDPAYQQSDDYSFWKKQNDIASEISSIKRQLRQQGVAEGLAPGQAAWKKEMMAKGAVSFKRDQHGGGAVDRIVAYDKDGKVVGGFNRKGVAEGLDPETTRLEQDVRNALENGDDYTAKQYAKMAPTPEAKKYLLNIIKQEMYGTDPEQGVAEGSEDLVQIEYWKQDSIEAGRWVKTQPMPRKVAEELLHSHPGAFSRGEIVDVKQGVEEGDQLDEMNPMLVRDGLQVVIDFLSQYPTATTLTAGVAGAAAGTAIIAKLVKNAWKNHKELEQLKQDVINWSSQKLHANKNVAAKGGKVAKIIQAEIARRKKDVAEGIKGWKHAHSDMMKHRAESGKDVHLVSLKKDGTESKMHDAKKSFKSEEEARAHHKRVKELNPNRTIAHNLYVGGKVEKLS
jgi:hypothetical protein